MVTIPVQSIGGAPAWHRGEYVEAAALCAFSFVSLIVGIERDARRRREKLVGIVDKAKDKAQVAKGEVKDKAGKATDDRSLQAEGKGDKASGNLKQAGEKVKDALK
jgi:uncharacterized protein YjbJ (UPF0337 family)